MTAKNLVLTGVLAAAALVVVTADAQAGLRKKKKHGGDCGGCAAVAVAAAPVAPACGGCGGVAYAGDAHSMHAAVPTTMPYSTANGVVVPAAGTVVDGQVVPAVGVQSGGYVTPASGFVTPGYYNGVAPVYNGGVYPSSYATPGAYQTTPYGSGRSSSGFFGNMTSRFRR